MTGDGASRSFQGCHQAVHVEPGHSLAQVAEFFRLATQGRRPFRISFDTFTITELARFGTAPDFFLESCATGHFSHFVSGKMEAYPC